MADVRTAQRSAQRTPQRRITIATAGNRFDVDESRIPGGMTYAWRRKTIGGQEDIEHQIMLEANGWLPVPPERHPELSGSRFVKGEEIVRGGLCLMEQPKEITEEAIALDRFAAGHAVTSQLQRLNLIGRKRGEGARYKREIGPPPNAIDD